MRVASESTNPLLLSRRAPVIQTEPFFYFEVADFLPADVYDACLAAFPGREWFAHETEGNKLRTSTMHHEEVAAKLLEAFPPWKKVIGWMRDDAFLNDFYSVARAGLRASRGRAGARPWSFSQDETPLLRWGHVTARAEFEFSRLERDAFVPPHTDGVSKLVSALLYFPDPAWDPNYGGDTIYLKAKGGEMPNWRNSRLNIDDLEPFYVNRFKPNTLAVFVKSAHSHHAVSPIACPPDMARNSLNFNVFEVPGTIARIRPRVSAAVRRLLRL